MQKQDQRRLANDLLDGLRRTVNENMKKVPDHWDGIELRHWISELAHENIAYKPMTHGRKLCYTNTRIVENI